MNQSEIKSPEEILKSTPLDKDVNDINERGIKAIKEAIKQAVKVTLEEAELNTGARGVMSLEQSILNKLGV